ncbi:methyl-accepting chemotaxis protein [Photobacterium sp. OFAV2-7]|uniref:methyl-accepting chemotaxis protein n=1 Tax=Photobacterium sp. OFAV2-7 TaxID=2917748 RepID=UPI001EF4E614|nr:methyl-accepting chemotaxis protein [Photobacterium sp. OFAV2-7]MCG7587759.1 methyl-accepting chemotaxis protein [Photobacterium sp. OFAV2-7]
MTNMSSTSLKGKLFLLLMISSMLVGGVVASLSYVKINELSEEGSFDQLVNYNREITSSIDAYAKSIKSSLNFAAKVYDENASYEQQGRFFTDIKTSTNSLVSYAGLVDEGIALMTGELLPISKLDITTREWYQCVMNTGKFCITKPYKSSEGELVIAWAEPIKRNGNIIGMLNVNKPMNDLSVLVSHMIENKAYKTVAFRKDGYVIGSSDEKNIGQNIYDITHYDESFLSSQLGKLTEIDGHFEYIMFSEEANLYVGVQVPVDYINSASRAAAITSVFVAISIVVLTLLFASVFIKRSISTPLEEMASYAQQIASGNLKNDIDLRRYKVDEISMLARSFSSMQESLSNTVHKLSQSAGDLELASNNVLGASQQNSISMRNQQQEITELAASMKQMQASVNEIAASAADTQTVTQDATEISQKSQNLVERTISSIRSVEEENIGIKTRIDSLKEDSAKISTILDVIVSISEQTNLLALNAAIEAARAGEHGRGFAVVADEVRNLAQKTQESSEEINSMIRAIQERSDDLTSAIEGSAEMISRAVELSDQVGMSIRKVNDSIKESYEMNVQIASAAEEQHIVTRELNNNIAIINDSSNAVTSESSQAVETASNLNCITSNLTEITRHFKV